MWLARAIRGERLISLLAAALLLIPGTAAEAQDPGNEPGLDLTSPVRQQLRLLTEAWRSWTRAYLQTDEDAAGNALDQLCSTTASLSMPYLPDFSNAASAFAVLAAREDDFDRARWTLEAARTLDPGRPETDFAAASIQRLQGDYLAAAGSSLKGYASLLRLPLERGILLHNVGLWLLYVLIVSGGLFIVLQIATKGGALFYDLARFMSPPLALTTADVLTLIALLWPLILPSGLLWLALYWSILLWGYGSASEKSVFVALWLILGMTPLALSTQQRVVQLTLAPPARAIDQLSAGRLSGTLFSDLAVLRTLMPEQPQARELVADLHRRFGQWEHARSIYTTLLETGELEGRASAGARSNIGVYHHRRKDYGTAINYFRQATRDDPRLPEAFFNLAQAYSQLYKFSDSNLALAKAKELDRDRVTVWEHAEVPVEESAIGVDGGLRQVALLRRELRARWYGDDSSTTAIDLWRRYLSLSVMAGALLLAVTLHLIRSQMGYRSSLLENRTLLPPSMDRWLKALVPGLESARRERGGRTFLALLIPAGLVVVLFLRQVGYRAPLAFDPGPGLPTALGIGGLALLFMVRLTRALKR